MLNYKDVAKTADVIIAAFINLNARNTLEKVSLLDACLGMVYASGKLLVALEKLGIVNSDQIETMYKEMFRAAKEDMDKDENIKKVVELLSTLENKQMSEEEDE